MKVDDIREIWSGVKPEDYELVQLDYLRRLIDKQNRLINKQNEQIVHLKSIHRILTFFGVLVVLGILFEVFNLYISVLP